MKHGTRLLVATALLGCLGCAAQKRVDLAPLTGGSAFLFKQFQAFDGDSGRPLRFSDVVRRCRKADVVLFGEQHNDPVCNQLEAQLLHALANAGRPVALAMEFFEADTQAALDAYLTGRIDEPAFLEQTRQSSAYARSHRPLIELSRGAHLPVIAVNAPRRLVHAYRKSGLPYEEYRASVDTEQRRWLPVSSEYLEGPYRERFAAVIRSHLPPAGPASRPATQPTSAPTTAPASQPVTRPASTMPTGIPSAMDWESFYKAQLLWDEAMAEAVANFRARFTRQRVLLIVGSFHVADDGGTTIKLQRRRPRDKLITVVYRGNPDARFELRAEDRGAGDIVVYGLSPPKPKTMPKPGGKPTTRPTKPAATSAPAR